MAEDTDPDTDAEEDVVPPGGDEENDTGSDDGADVEGFVIPGSEDWETGSGNEETGNDEDAMPENEDADEEVYDFEANDETE